MGLKKTVLLVAALNFGYFLVELSFSQVFNSLSLLSDSLDFLEDAAINLLIFLAFAWSALARKRLSYLLAFILLIPGAVFITEAISKLNEPVVPNGLGMSVIGVGALIINLFCAVILTQHKSEEGGLAKAAYLSARNDAVANILIITAGGITTLWVSQIPDLAIGLIIFAMNFDSAMQVLKSQR